MPDVISRAAAETRLTKETLIRILERVSIPKLEPLFRNPEGWSNTFIEVIKGALADHVAERIRYHTTDKLFDGPDEKLPFFPTELSQPQKEHYDGGLRSLYDRVQVDSDVERRFVKDRLVADEANVVCYFKFPTRFLIEAPKVIGNYNPDWGIVRVDPEGGYSLELVRETKGTDDLSKLRFASEGRKIRVAQRYFATLGIDYRALSPDVERYWESTPEADPPRARVLQMSKRSAPAAGSVSVRVYDLLAAAGAFSEGHEPEVTGYVELPAHVARGQGLFVARISGDSMDRVAPPGALCLWQLMSAPGVAGAADGDKVIVARVESEDAALGEFTFKRLTIRDGRQRLEPMSRNTTHVGRELEDGVTHNFIARFLQVVDDVIEPATERPDGTQRRA